VNHLRIYCREKQKRNNLSAMNFELFGKGWVISFKIGVGEMSMLKKIHSGCSAGDMKK